MDLAATIYQQIRDDLDCLEALLRQSTLRYASVAKLPVAEHSGETDHVFDDINEITVSRATGQEALDAYLSIIKPQYNSAGLSPRAGRRIIGIVHVCCESPNEVVRLVNKINKQKDALRGVFGAIENLRQRQRHWKSIDAGVMPLTVYRHLYCISEAKPIEKIYFSWSAAGFSQRQLTRKEAENIIKVRADRMARNGFFEPDLVNADIAKISHIDEENLILRRPTKVHPIVELYGENKRATTPILCIQSEPLKFYGDLHDYAGELEAETAYSKNELMPVVPECHIYQRKG